MSLLILDAPTIGEAVNVWRWNVGGLGFSKNGYNGPYETAITADGQIVANFITSGSLVANIIKAGVLQSQDGSSYWDLETGELSFVPMLPRKPWKRLKIVSPPLKSRKCTAWLSVLPTVTSSKTTTSAQPFMPQFSPGMKTSPTPWMKTSSSGPGFQTMPKPISCGMMHTSVHKVHRNRLR